MPVEELAAQIDRWRAVEGGGAPRLRVIADTARTLRDLSDAERRVLARGVADRGLPELATRIGQPAGLSADEARRGARALLSMDNAALDDLAADVRSPDGRRRLLDRVEGVTEEHLPLPTAGDRLADLPPPPGTGSSSSGATDPSARVDAPPPPDAPPGTDGPPPTGDDGRPLATAELPDLRRDTASDYQPARYEPQRYEARRYEARRYEPRHDRPGGTTGGDGDRRSRPDADVTGTVRDAGHLAPAGPGRAAPAMSGLALEAAADGARDRLATVRTAAPDAPDGATLLALLDTVPDGWERRRALRRLLQDHEIHDVDAGAVLDRFARPSDRVVVAAALVAADLATTATVVDRLPPRDAARLGRREARRSR